MSKKEKQKFVNLQLKDAELSCFLKLALVLDDTVGGQYVFLGTDTHPVLSPSRARANSKINFPSRNKNVNFHEFRISFS